MAKAGYSSQTEAAVALTGGAAKSVLGVTGPAQFGVDLQSFWVAFDGVTATAVPVLIEVMYATFATNAPGTASTGVGEQQNYGRTITPGFVAARNWTTEPTVLSLIKEFLLTPNGGLVAYDWPLGRTPDSAVSQGFVIRCTAPAAVNVRASMDYERT